MKNYLPIVLISLGVLAWGVFHAVGAYRLNHNAARPLVVVACAFAFLGFWWVMLAVRAARLRRQQP